MEKGTAGTSQFERRVFPFLLAGMSILSFYFVAEGTGNRLFIYWIAIFGSVAFPVMTIVTAIGQIRGWSEAYEREVVDRSLSFIVLTPLILIGLFVASAILWNSFGWLASTPPWAVVIILLLLRNRMN